MFSKEVYIQRRKKLKELVGSGLIVITGNLDSPMNCKDNIYKFRQDSTFLYFFGLDEPGLNATIDCDTGEEVIYGNDISMDDIIWMGPQKSMKNKAEQCGIENTCTTSKIFETVKKARQSGQAIHILPPYRSTNKIFLSELLVCAVAEVVNFVSASLIRACVLLRSTKEKVEINLIEQQMDNAYLMHTTAMWMAQPGTNEYQISGALEGIALSANGALSFPIILTKNGQTLHNHNHNNMLQKGDLLLVDAGCESPMHYATDHTRTSPVGGTFSNNQKEIYEIVLSANNAAAKMAKPGVLFRDCHLEAATVITSGLKALGIMKGDVHEAVKEGAHALFFPHGLGHMMGLDVHDMEDYGEDFVGYTETITRSKQFGTRNLRLARKLEPNFVITNEPGIYFIPDLIDLWQSEKKHSAFINYERLARYKNFGGIRLEDDLLITEEGSRNLGKRIPITPNDVEAVVNGLK